MKYAQDHEKKGRTKCEYTVLSINKFLHLPQHQSHHISLYEFMMSAPFLATSPTKKL